MRTKKIKIYLNELKGINDEMSVKELYAKASEQFNIDRSFIQLVMQGYC